MAKYKKIAALMALVATIGSASVFTNKAFAATPTLALASAGDGDTVQITVNGDPNASVIMYYTKTNVGQEAVSLGTTSSSGYLSTTLSTSQYGIASGSNVYVTTGGINGTQSAEVVWPVASTTGTFSVSQTSVVLAVGQSSTITVYNNPGTALYMSNNSNPQVANVNINSNQVTVTGISNGSTVVTLCAQGYSADCVSTYVSVQNGGTQALTFSLSNVTVAPGQSVPITITGGSGTYEVLNNSNSAAIQTNISGSTITLTSNSTTGSSAITVCSSNMSSCGIINATAGSSSTVALSFSQNNPTLYVGQSLNITVSGGASTSYYVSSNSNASAIGTTINGSTITLTGAGIGSSTITVCSSSGGCGSLTATTNYVSTGGTFQLSQTNLSMLVGQVLSISISGGTSPYSLGANAGNVIQASLSGNVITISAIAAGSSVLNVCTAGGACLTLSVTVNASSSATPISFSQNNLSVNTGAVTPVTILGGGGYYVSTSSNPNVASVQINSNTALVTGLTPGSSNVSICQTGGQCAILSLTVLNGASSAAVPAFSQANPTVSVGQTLTETISNGASSSYYISANTNPSVASLSLSGNQLIISGLATGSSVAVICAAANSCASLTFNVGGAVSGTATPLEITSTSLPVGTVGQAYTAQLTASGGNGNYTFSANSGSLPAGLTLSSNGSISGTPATAGSSSFIASVSDSAGSSATLNFTVTINSAGTSAPAAVTSAVPAGSYPSGELIDENGTIYMVYQNTKVGFANAPAFLGLGFNFSNVTAVADSGLTLSDKVVVTSDGAHPRGTWVANGQTVYFVTPGGLIPVADWTTFLNNGGQASFIVPANTYDLSLPTLSIMTSGDSRVQ